MNLMRGDCCVKSSLSSLSPLYVACFGIAITIIIFDMRKVRGRNRAGDAADAAPWNPSSEIEEEDDKANGISCFYMQESSMAHDVPFGKDFVIEQIFRMQAGPDPKTTEVSIFCTVNFIKDCGLLTGKIFRSSVNTQRGITKTWFEMAQRLLQASS